MFKTAMMVRLICADRTKKVNNKVPAEGSLWRANLMLTIGLLISASISSTWPPNISSAKQIARLVSTLFNGLEKSSLKIVVTQ